MSLSVFEKPVSIFVFLMFASSFVQSKKITVYLIGDSTMADKEVRAYPETGWGMPFATFFDPAVRVDNRAKNGRSTKSFIAEGFWQPVLDNLRAGDYVFIQFGHNDEGKEKVGRYTTPDEFKANLTRYIVEAQSKGAVPVLITPVARRTFDANGQIKESHPVYADAVRAVSAAVQVPLIDLDEKSKALLQEWGVESSKKLFNYLQSGEHPNYPEGHADDTHFNELGARKMAEIVLGEIRQLLPGLAGHIRQPQTKDLPAKIVVAQDGTGDYRTVQAALDAVPLSNRQRIAIFIRSGRYREKLHLDSSKDLVSLTGEDEFNTILCYDDHPGMVSPQGDSINTRNSYSFLVKGNDFSASQITFCNEAGFSAGQAVALDVEGDRAVFRDCRIMGNQDVLFLNSEHSRQYYRHCYIEGTTDFIFGAATAWFEDCHIHSKKDSHVTAASTPKDHPYGFVFYDCMLTGDTAIHKATLGRPWRPWGYVAYIHSYIGGHIRPEGWSNWNNTDNYKTARYGEYKNYGPGADVASRFSWCRQFTDKEASAITIKNIFGDWYPADH